MSAGSQDGVSERDLKSKILDLVVMTEKGRGSVLQQAKAEENARLTVVSPSNGRTAAVKGTGKAGTGGKTTSVISGDLLTALFRPEDVRAIGEGASPRVASRLKTVVGEGHTVLRRVSENGAEVTSSGDKLNVVFKELQGPGGGSIAQGARKTQAVSIAKTGSTDVGAKGGGAAGGAEQIATAVQEGNVSMQNLHAANPATTGAAPEQHATAQRAAY